MTTLVKDRGRGPDQCGGKALENVTEVGIGATGAHTVDEGKGGGQCDDQAEQDEGSALHDDRNRPVRDDPAGIGQRDRELVRAHDVAGRVAETRADACISNS